MMMRRLVLGLSCTALLAGVLAFHTGAFALVETDGNSMAPRINTGDLVLIRAKTSYRVGDVAAYTSADLHRVVLHRVVAIHDGRYTFRGDHNDFDDPEQPTEQQLIGTELLHIPAGGVWMDRLTSPTALGILAFGLLAGGGTAVQTRNRRRKTTMSQHATPTSSSRWLTSWSPRLRRPVAIAAGIGAIGLILGAVSWTRPTTVVETVTDQAARTMTFSYTADVPSSPAYDGTEVTAPQAIFRKLADEVDVRYSYRGEPGTVSVAAELATASGWQATVPLRPAVTFGDTKHTGSVHLDLKRLEARAQAAAEATGIPAAEVEITVVPTITTRDGDTFAPTLAFAMTPLQLTLVDGPSALTVTDTTSTQRPGRTENTLGLARYNLSVSALRSTSLVLALAGLLLLGLVGSRARRAANSEGAIIRRRYATILLQVEPLTSPPGRPVVDVAEFPALARLAERYGLLVMHWTRSNVETFIVHDDGITYRYRTGTSDNQTPTSLTPQPLQDTSGSPT